MLFSIFSEIEHAVCVSQVLDKHVCLFVIPMLIHQSEEGLKASFLVLVELDRLQRRISLTHKLFFILNRPPIFHLFFDFFNLGRWLTSFDANFQRRFNTIENLKTSLTQTNFL